MKAVILAGGLGLRLRPLTDDRPKAMLQINGATIAEYQVTFFQRSGINEVIFACGYRWEKIKEVLGYSYDTTRVHYSIESQPQGTGGALKKVLEEFKLTDSQEDIAVANGDLVLDFDFRQMLEWHNATHPIVTILVVPYRSPYGVVEIDKLRTVRKFEEKPEFKDVWINGGFYIINPSRIFGRLPDTGDMELQTFPKLITFGEISAYPHHGFWRSVDTLEDLKAVAEQLATAPTPMIQIGGVRGMKELTRRHPREKEIPMERLATLSVADIVSLDRDLTDRPMRRGKADAEDFLKGFQIG